MTKVTILPHEEICPQGAEIEVEPGISLCDAMLSNGIEIEHACEKSCACTTCHVYVRQGFDSLPESSEDEDDYLDKAWGLDMDSRLSCQAIVADEPLTTGVTAAAAAADVGQWFGKIWTRCERPAASAIDIEFWTLPTNTTWICFNVSFSSGSSHFTTLTTQRKKQQLIA